MYAKTMFESMPCLRSSVLVALLHVAGWILWRSGPLHSISTVVLVEDRSSTLTFTGAGSLSNRLNIKIEEIGI